MIRSAAQGQTKGAGLESPGDVHGLNASNTALQGSWPRLSAPPCTEGAFDEIPRSGEERPSTEARGVDTARPAPQQVGTPEPLAGPDSGVCCVLCPHCPSIARNRLRSDRDMLPPPQKA